MKSIRKNDVKELHEATEAFWIAARDVNNYKVGFGDDFNELEQRFLHVTEAIDDGKIVWASAWFCKKYTDHMYKIHALEPQCIAVGDLEMQADAALVELE